MFDDGHHTDPVGAERARLEWLLVRSEGIRQQSLKRLREVEFEIQVIKRRLEEL